MRKEFFYLVQNFYFSILIQEGVRKAYLILTVIFILSELQSGMAQRQRNMNMIGIGMSFGIVTYQGELDDDLALKFSHIGYGVHATAPLNKHFDLRLAFFRGTIGASDVDASAKAVRNRNLNFTSEIDELSVVFMYKLRVRKFSFTKKNQGTPYLFLGAAGFYFNPQAVLESGGTIPLQPLGTEGQYLKGNNSEPYDLFQFCIPFGGGYLQKVSNNLDLGVEVGFRKTFTDYLDDVSTYYPDKESLRARNGQIAVLLSDPAINYPDPDGHPAGSPRGNPQDNDWYEYINVHLTYYFPGNIFKHKKGRGISHFGTGRYCK